MAIFIKDQDLVGDLKTVGVKAKSLAQLQQQTHLPVLIPSFVVLDSAVVNKWLANEFTEQEIENNLQAIVHYLSSNSITTQNSEKTWAVRSAALVEDSKESSFAGQFLTKTEVKTTGLQAAIEEVIKHSQTVQKGVLFSVIIQEFIVADYAGVTFSRNPLGTRDMVIEYVKGAGINLVEGRVKPARMEFYWHQQLKSIGAPKFSRDLWQRMVKFCQGLEQDRGLAQDVEWLVKDQKLLVVQARPVTTITAEQVAKFKYLENHLPRKQRYLYEKTDISAVVPKVVQFNLDLLNKIYEKGGPVETVYNRYGVDYRPSIQFKTIGQELFVDREAELKSLLPAYSYFRKDNFKPYFSSFAGLPRTLKNSWRLNRLRLDEWKMLLKDLQSGLTETLEKPVNLEQLWQYFAKAYESVFAVNLLTQKAYKLLDLSLKDEAIGIGDILALANLDFCPEFANDYQQFLAAKDNLQILIENDSQQWQGNGLNLDDNNQFVIQQLVNGPEMIATKKWWDGLGIIKQKYLEKIIFEAKIFDQLREIGRWLTVKNINLMKKFLFEVAATNDWENQRLILFASWQELTETKLDRTDCEQRLKQFEYMKTLSFPNRISDRKITAPSEIIAVSSGLAAGTLIDKEMLQEIGSETDDAEWILYTDMLSPELTKYFDQIKGIVSLQGGLLSHLAIMAREKSLPMLVGVDLNEQGLTIGDKVKIDAEKGLIENQSKSKKGGC